MTIGEVAVRLAVSPSRVRQLDAELRPERCGCGVRRYEVAAVAAYERQRMIDREALANVRAERMRRIRADHPPTPRRSR